MSGCGADDDGGDDCMVTTIFKDDDAAVDGHENDSGASASDARTTAVQIFHEAAHFWHDALTLNPSLSLETVHTPACAKRRDPLRFGLAEARPGTCRAVTSQLAVVQR